MLNRFNAEKRVGTGGFLRPKDKATPLSLRVSSSMETGKGLPEQEKVKAFLALDCWQVNREFSSELLRAFSCMLSGKGLPKEDDVKAFLFQAKFLVHLPALPRQALFHSLLFGKAFATAHGGKGSQQFQAKFVVHLPALPRQERFHLFWVGQAFASKHGGKGSQQFQTTWNCCDSFPPCFLLKACPKKMR
jgi:hypothetical protein